MLFLSYFVEYSINWTIVFLEFFFIPCYIDVKIIKKYLQKHKVKTQLYWCQNLSWFTEPIDLSLTWLKLNLELVFFLKK